MEDSSHVGSKHLKDSLMGNDEGKEKKPNAHKK